jgi:predicted nucleic acid-binding protein
MTRPLVLFDTSIYIPYLRAEAYTALIEEAVRTGQIRLSSVVLAELYAGTRSVQDKRDLDVALRSYQSLGFLAVPTAED